MEEDRENRGGFNFDNFLPKSMRDTPATKIVSVQQKKINE